MSHGGAAGGSTGYGGTSSMGHQPAGSMEWYTPSASYSYQTGAPAGGHASSYSMHGSMSGGAGSFDDEPPLLEGAHI